MKTLISQIELGKRICQLRKSKGLSQEDLSKRIQISRSSLTQIELGNRNIDIFELQNLVLVFNISLDDIMSFDFSVNEATSEISKDIQLENRISVPTLKIDKFRNVLLYILEKCGGKPNIGETVLYKLLYFSDFNYYELYEEHLTGAKYRKLPFGPVPQMLDSIINNMIENQQLKRVKTEFHGYPQTRYLALKKADLTQMKASEKEVIDKVIEQMSDWSASMLSNYSHGDKPWKVTENNEEIDYELAFYRKPPYSVRIYDNEE